MNITPYKSTIGFALALALTMSGLVEPLVGMAQPTQVTAPPTSTSDHAIGAPKTFGNLTVFPIASSNQTELGPIIALSDALRAKSAEVRETSSGGTVNSLVIQNKGKETILVLAGTIVKGGKQDREIGQDFIIEPGKTSSVDAFCVEHGRWTAQRNGQQTDGKFSSDSMATSNVRIAGQYKKDQSEVWSKVGQTNAAHKKHSNSQTLTATLDAADVMAQRAAIATQVEGYLAQTKPDDVVGFAYAIDGKVRSARWFANHAVWSSVAHQLVSAAVVDAMTADAHRKSSRTAAPTAPPPSPSDVENFIASVGKEAVKEDRSTNAANVNEYKEGADAFGSSTYLKAPSKPSGKGTKVSSDFSAK